MKYEEEENKQAKRNKTMASTLNANMYWNET